MNRRVFIKTVVMSATAVFLSGCGLNVLSGQSREEPMQKVISSAGIDKAKILVVYFSWSGNTRKVAQQIQSMIGCNIFELQPQKAYPKDYESTRQRAHAELDNNIHVEMAGNIPDLAKYDIVFLGYPVWAHRVPRIIITALENPDFTGKTVIPFCTSASSDIEETLPEIQDKFKNINWKEGLTANDEDDIKPWIDKQLNI